jgi:hypothetical protein
MRARADPLTCALTRLTRTNCLDLSDPGGTGLQLGCGQRNTFASDPRAHQMSESSLFVLYHDDLSEPTPT